MTNAVSWSSSDTGVATITSGGLATSIPQGTSTISASGGATGSTTLTVGPATLVSIAVTPANPSVPKGSTQQFTATGTYTDNSTQNLTSTVTWTSSATSIATINSSGLASTVAQGTSTITATSGPVNGSTTLTVTAPPYSYERTITIDHTKVPNTDQTDFPMLISGTYSYLATVANGGKVQNTTGYDIIFASEPSGNVRLDHEIESYDPTTGTISFWIRIPALS